MNIMTPREITSELDRHIIGQDKAKRAVAIALRNRWRRMQLDEAMRSEITPKNIFETLLPSPVNLIKFMIVPLQHQHASYLNRF